MRPTIAEIDLEAVKHNVRVIRELISPARLCAVVKADGYGHGDVPVAQAALDAGAEWLAVALVEEGARLREAGIAEPILLLSQPPAEDAMEVVSWDLTPTVYTFEFAEALASSGPGMSVHVKVDTGMHRVGASPEDATGLIEQMSSGSLTLGGIWTHFPVADEDPEFTEDQIDRFLEIAGGVDAPLIHMANTAGALLYEKSRADLCRVGLGIYGLHPCQETRDLVDLQPAMRVVSKVSHVQRLPAGARPSYGRVTELARETTVATVPIGYADGLPRSISESGEVLVGGLRRKLAGRVTMDQIVVDVGEHAPVPGDEVVVLGSQQDEQVTADELAELAGTISYEIVCSIGPRVPRKYTG